jgi:hypothetical protein
MDKAVFKNDKAASFFSVPDRWLNKPSTPFTSAGTKAIVCRSVVRKSTAKPPEFRADVSVGNTNAFPETEDVELVTISESRSI